MNDTEIIYEKNCKTCGELKPLTKFPKCPTTRDKRMGTCNSCRHLSAHYSDLAAMRPKRRMLTNRHRSVNRPAYLANKMQQSSKYHRAAKLLPNTLTGSEWTAIKSFYNESCAYCSAQPEKLVRCRIIPVSKGGGLVAQNIIPLCVSCSASKKEKIIYPVAMHTIGHDTSDNQDVPAESTSGRQIAGPSRTFSTTGNVERSTAR